MKIIKIGFIGLGNVGSKLAGSLLRNGLDLTVRDLKPEIAEPLMAQGAKWGESPRSMMEDSDMLITCLPNPAVSAKVMEDEDGILKGISHGKVWAEMSTTDEMEVKRIGKLVKKFGGELVLAGNIIIRQRGTKVHPGLNVGIGKDHTIFSKIKGKVFFKKNKQKTIVSVVPS